MWLEIFRKLPKMLFCIVNIQRKITYLLAATYLSFACRAIRLFSPQLRKSIMLYISMHTMASTFLRSKHTKSYFLHNLTYAYVSPACPAQGYPRALSSLVPIYSHLSCPITQHNVLGQGLNPASLIRRQVMCSNHEAKAPPSVPNFTKGRIELQHKHSVKNACSLINVIVH